MQYKIRRILLRIWVILINPYIILLFVTFLSLAPDNNLTINEKYIFPNLDKIVHLSMYFGLSFSIVLHFFHKTAEKEKLMLFTFFFSSCYGVLMEFFQYISNLGRNANIYDFIANEVGIVLAIIALKLLSKSKSKIFHFD